MLKKHPANVKCAQLRKVNTEQQCKSPQTQLFKILAVLDKQGFTGFQSVLND